MAASRSSCTSLKHRCRWCGGDCPQHPALLLPWVSVEWERPAAATELPGHTMGLVLLETRCWAETFAAKWSHRRKNQEDPTTFPHRRVLTCLKGATSLTKISEANYMSRFSGVEIKMKKPVAGMKHVPQCERWSMVLGTTRAVESYLAAQRHVQFWFLGSFNFFSLYGKLLCSLGSKTDQADHYTLPCVKTPSPVYRFLCFITTKSLLQ